MTTPESAGGERNVKHFLQTLQGVALRGACQGFFSFLPFCTAIRTTYQAGCKSGQKVRRAEARPRQEDMAGSDGSCEPGSQRDSGLQLLQQQPTKTLGRE